MQSQQILDSTINHRELMFEFLYRLRNLLKNINAQIRCPSEISLAKIFLNSFYVSRLPNSKMLVIQQQIRQSYKLLGLDNEIIRLCDAFLRKGTINLQYLLNLVGRIYSSVLEKLPVFSGDVNVALLQKTDPKETVFFPGQYFVRAGEALCSVYLPYMLVYCDADKSWVASISNFGVQQRDLLVKVDKYTAINECLLSSAVTAEPISPIMPQISPDSDYEVRSSSISPVTSDSSLDSFVSDDSITEMQIDPEKSGLALENYVEVEDIPLLNLKIPLSQALDFSSPSFYFDMMVFLDQYWKDLSKVAIVHQQLTEATADIPMPPDPQPLNQHQIKRKRCYSKFFDSINAEDELRKAYAEPPAKVSSLGKRQ